MLVELDVVEQRLKAVLEVLEGASVTGSLNGSETYQSGANKVMSQMLPPGVVKGGTTIKLRVGEAASRRYV